VQHKSHGLTRLTTDTAREIAPTWSPDGTTLAYRKQQPNSTHGRPYNLWTMAADGSGQTQLATNVSAASWSPDGTMVALISGGTPRTPRGELWVTQADGSARVEVQRAQLSSTGSAFRSRRRILVE